MLDNAGDHPLVQQLFVAAYQCPLAEDFQSRLDEPSYEPSDRLLLKRGTDLIGHVQVSKQFGWFQGQRFPLARLQDFLTLPEYRSGALDGPLLEMAESVATEEGSILALVRTERPEWFDARGWSGCRGQGHTRANTRAFCRILILRRPDCAETTRPWKYAPGGTLSSTPCSASTDRSRPTCGEHSTVPRKPGSGWQTARLTIKS